MTLFRSEGANFDATNNLGTLPADVRKGYEGLFTSTGVLPSSASPLVEGAGDFTYTVHTGYWVTSRGGSDGYHYWGNVGDISVTTASDGSTLVAPASGLSRIDIIYALHPSAAENGDSTSTPVVTVAKGAEASTPVAPTLPAGALELARNTMTSAATSTSSAGNTITNTARPAAVRGTYRRRMIRTRTTPQSLANNATVPIGAWNESTVSTGLPDSDFSTPGDAYTVNFTGWVGVRARLSFDANVTGIRAAQVIVNGTIVQVERSPATGFPVSVSVLWEGPVTSGSTISVQGYQNSGGALNVAAGSSFAIERLT